MLTKDRIVPSTEFCQQVEALSGQKVTRCNQCGKCTAGCPAAYTMDLGPRQVMRAIQLGLKEEVMVSPTIWICLFCQTCSARCPMGIDVARTIESLCLMTEAEHRKPPQKEIELFHRLFVDSIQRHGHLWELGLGGLYNLRSGHLLDNISFVPKMLQKGKLRLLPPRTGRGARMRDIFARAREVEATRLKKRGG